MPQPDLLLIEDDEAIAELIVWHFAREGFAVRQTPDGEQALILVDERVPDIVLLDWMIESLPGIEVCRRLRRNPRSANVPIIMLTARGEEADRVNGLDAGVDDYVVKPFSTRELVARIKAVLRRVQSDDGSGSIALGGLRIDGPAHRVYAGDALVDLGPTEYRLLHFFMSHPERVYTRAQVLDHVWGGSVYIEERTVDVHIRRLRKALEPFALDGLVQTVRGTGYRLSDRR